MEKAKKFLELTKEESEPVLELTFPPHSIGTESCFYEYFALKGMRVDHFEPSLIYCSFKVPPRLTNRGGNLASGAVANLVDIAGNAVARKKKGETIKVSVDMSILYISLAKIGDDLEIVSRLLGQSGSYYGIVVVVKNKTTGEVDAEGRLSLLGKQTSKL
ncbi:hypothetical protein ACH5RR_025184 [Cinchona calisaya]|uniref:Acyl-coenzyme A thioesterase 13 n=1 Tax=Cinchona calisaya TaxID=153742 RepID=A0ABD2Z225_9GENT